MHLNLFFLHNIYLRRATLDLHIFLLSHFCALMMDKGEICPLPTYNNPHFKVQLHLAPGQIQSTAVEGDLHLKAVHLTRLLPAVH